MLAFDTPLIVAVVTPRTLNSDIKAVRHGPADAVEFRADLQKTHDTALLIDQLAILREQCDVPLLFTLRDHAEGGGYSGPDAEREALYRAMLPHIDALDIELANAAVYDHLRTEAHERAVTTILSVHTFDLTPPGAELDRIVLAAEPLRPDVIKIATRCATPQEALTLLALPGRYPGRRLAVVGMGPLGRAVRAVAASFGSVLGYAPATEAVASGQLSVKDLHNAWRMCSHD